MCPSQNPEPGNSFNDLKKYVRVTRETQRFVEFDFAIDDPSLFVELVLPKKAFTEFCNVNHVLFMTAEQEAEVDSEMAKWRYGEETLMAHNHDRDNPASQKPDRNTE